jgi:methylase of polypeptide subunit release factors
LGKNYLESVVYMVKISKRGGTTIVKRVFIHGVDTVDLGWIVRGESMVDVAQRTYGLDRRSAPHGPWRRGLRSTIHFFSYHFILKRRTTRVTRAAGFRLTVRPTVFHPRYFITSEFFASFIGRLDLSGRRVVDIGTGSGILALAAARAGAANVTAIDINPIAALTAAENARSNGLGDRVTAVCSNLLSALAPGALFDVIISSPPSFPGEPRDIADRAWHAGPNYRDVASLFDQARERLAPGGCLYILLSSDSDLNLFGALIAKARFQARLVAERSIFIESLIIYTLQAH